MNIAKRLFGLDKKDEVSNDKNDEVSNDKKKQFSKDYARLNPNLLIPEKSEEEE